MELLSNLLNFWVKSHIHTKPSSLHFMTASLDLGLFGEEDRATYASLPDQLESVPPNVQKADRVLGVDLGRTHINDTSSGDKFSGKHVTKIRDKFSRVRASLQRRASKGTRSTRRRARQVLQRLSGRERRFQTNINHTVSYRVVQQAKTNNRAIALEELTGIREKTNQLPRSKTERRRSNSWAFFQLRMFVLYKGIKFGVAVHLVDPRYTSKSCHHPLGSRSPTEGNPPAAPSHCKVLGDRQGKKFSCLNLACGWVGDADLNGANNISGLGALINCPGGSSTMFCSVQDVVLRAAENPVLAVLGRAG